MYKFKIKFGLNWLKVKGKGDGEDDDLRIFYLILLGQPYIKLKKPWISTYSVVHSITTKVGSKLLLCPFGRCF